MDNLEKQVQNLLTKYGESIIGEMKTRLKNLDKVSTGKLLNSLDYEVTVVNGNYLLKFTAIDYAVFVDKGRKPGKMPPINAILKQVNKENLQQKGKDGKYIPKKSMAFIIAKSIGKKGIAPTNFFTVSKSRRVKQMNIDLAKIIGEQIKKQVIQ